MNKKEFNDFELMFETYEKIKELLRKNAMRPEDEISKEELEKLGLDSNCLKRIKINNYLLDYINLFEKLEINELDDNKFQYIINKLFINQDGNKIGEINPQDMKTLYQIRNCFAHGHYYIDINEEGTFVVFSNSDIKGRISLNDLKSIIENLILMFKDHEEIYVAHLSDLPYSGYDLNLFINSVLENGTKTEIESVKYITPKRYATLLQSWNYYCSYMFENMKKQKTFNPEKYFKNRDLLIKHPPIIQNSQIRDSKLNEIYINNLEFNGLTDSSLKDVLSDFYAYFVSRYDVNNEEDRERFNSWPTKKYFEKHNLDFNFERLRELIEQVEQYLDGNIDKDSLDLDMISKVYMVTAPRFLRIQNSEFEPKANNMFQHFVINSARNDALIFPALSEFVVDKTSEKAKEERMNIVYRYIDKFIKNKIMDLKKELGKVKLTNKQFNKYMEELKTKEDKCDEEGIFLKLTELIKSPSYNDINNVSNVIEHLEEILHGDDKITIQRAQQICEMALTECDYYDYSKLLEAIRNTIAHGNVDIDYSDYYSNGVLHKVINDDRNVNFDNIRYNFQDFDEKTGATTFLLVNIRGEDLEKIIEADTNILIREGKNIEKDIKDDEER